MFASVNDKLVSILPYHCKHQGILDFSMIGILSQLADILAENKIGIFAVSTFNTDYILVKEENFDRALKALASAGYDIV